MKLQKIQLFVVILLLIVLSVFVLRPSIYPLAVYEFHRSKSQKRERRDMIAQIDELENTIRELRGEPDNTHLNIDDVSDTTAAIGLLQSQIDNAEQLLTNRMNTAIESALNPLEDRIEELESVSDSYIDESGNIIVNSINDIDLSNKIKNVMQSRINELDTNINTSKESIETNKGSLATLRSYIEELIRDINTKVTGNTSTVGNNITAINDMANTIATIIPYTEFRDDLRDTYRQQYLQHLETEH